MKLVYTFWLLLFGSILAFAVPNSESQPQTPTFGYDEQVQPSIAYDRGFPSAFVYDAASAFLADEKENRTARTDGFFARFAEFLAAESAGVPLSQKGLNLVENHLGTFPPQPYNAGMMQRLNDAFAAGGKVTGADAKFYLHEASEATMVGRGIGQEAAHAAALEKYGVSPFSIYHPEVIQANPSLFNNAWRNYWNLPPTKP